MRRLKGSADQLTFRELEVLKLIATGSSTKEIAASLHITFKTAACHRSRIMEKLDIHEVANLTRYAIRQGYVDAGGESVLVRGPTERSARVPFPPSLQNGRRGEPRQQTDKSQSDR